MSDPALSSSSARAHAAVAAHAVTVRRVFARLRLRWRDVDARLPQLAILASFIAYAKFGLGAAIRPEIALAYVVTALVTEFAFAKVFVRRFEPRSPLVTAFSLTLMLRCDGVLVAIAIACGAIAAKHLVRVRGKHVFNPSNIAIVAALLAGVGWVSSGAWGHAIVPIGAVACLGVLVTLRASRLDLAVSFLALWSFALFARAAWLGDPFTIPLHQLLDGTLIVFSFFMITDPRATPDHRAARVLFALALVALAYVLRFHAWQPDALLYALAAVSLCTPLLDRVFAARRFRWAAASQSLSQPLSSQSKESSS